MKKRLNPADRKAQIMIAAVSLAEKNGWAQLTRDGVATAAGVSAGLVTFYFPAIDDLRQQVMRKAVRDEILSIVADGLVARNPAAMEASVELRQKAVAAAVS